MKPLLIFLNEVAGGRKLIAAARERAPEASYVVVVAPQNQPVAGQLFDRGEAREAARSRVEITLSVLEEVGIEAIGEVMDPDPDLALGDAIRSHRPSEVLLSCLYDSRFGLTRKDLVEWAGHEFEPETTVTHIPVRIEDDSIRLDLTHTLVVANQTLADPELAKRLIESARERPHRYTIVAPETEGVRVAEMTCNLARLMTLLYEKDIDATGQPMSPDPFSSVENAIAHYRVDDILISTLPGEESRWLAEDLVGKVREITDKPVAHHESGSPPEAVASVVAEGSSVASGSGVDSGDSTAEASEV